MEVPMPCIFTDPPTYISVLGSLPIYATALDEYVRSSFIVISWPFVLNISQLSFAFSIVKLLMVMSAVKEGEPAIWWR